MGIFKNYVSKAPERVELPVGTCLVTLVSYKETNSFEMYNGEVKEKEFGWALPVNQLAVILKGVDVKGVHTHRFQEEGYLKYASLTDEEKASGLYTDIQGYACAVNKKNQLVRIPDEENTKACMNILDQFFAAVGLPEGSTIDDLDTVIEAAHPFEVTIVNKPYNGEKQLRISKFAKASAKTEAKVMSDIDA